MINHIHLLRAEIYNMLNDEQKKQAIDWYANKGFDLSTIAQHFGLTRDELIKEIRTK